MNFRKRPLVAGAAALFAAGVANRVIGTVYRVLLVRVAGEDVVGLFQMTLPVYRLAWTLATAGIYVGIARLSADAMGAGNRDLSRRYGRVGMSLTVVTAALASALLFATRHLWANHVLTDSRTVVTLTLFPLLLFPAALSANYRGVLQGQERLGPVALSSVAEATSRVPVVLFLVTWLLPFGPEWAAGGIAGGLVFGELVSVLLLIWFVRRIWVDLQGGDTIKRTGRSQSASAATPPRARKSRVRFVVLDQVPLALSLLGLAVPVLASGIINGTLGMFNVALIPRQLLQAGFDTQEATALYGRLFGMALPVLYMPMVAVHPLVHAAIPAVAKRLAAGRRQSVRRLLLQCFSLAAAVSVVTTFALSRYGENLGVLLYGTQGLGRLIAPLAVAAPFTYLGHVAAGILYGLGHTGVTMVNAILGNVLRLGLIYVLVADPAWGILGALWAVVADYALTALLNLGSVYVLIRRAFQRTG